MKRFLMISFKYEQTLYFSAITADSDQKRTFVYDYFCKEKTDDLVTLSDLFDTVIKNAKIAI